MIYFLTQKVSWVLIARPGAKYGLYMCITFIRKDIVPISKEVKKQRLREFTIIIAPQDSGIIIVNSRLSQTFWFKSRHAFKLATTAITSYVLINYKYFYL